MKKIITLFVFVLFANLALVAQSAYSTQTNEVLQSMKAEAATSGDYAKAAEIKKELDARTAEEQNIVTLQTQLDASIKSEDYGTAAKLKEQVATAKSNLDRKKQLRKDIAASILAEDYAKAASLKKELEILNGGAPEAVVQQAPPPSQPAPASQPEPSRVVSQPESAPSNPEPAKTQGKAEPDPKARVGIDQFCMGVHGTLGLRGGYMKQKGVGFYLSMGFTTNAFKSVSNDATISGNTISNQRYGWIYTGTAHYSREQVYAGMIFRLFGDVKEISGGFATGLGIAENRYMYDYNEYSNGVFQSTQTLLDKDKTSSGEFSMEEAFVLSIKQVNVSLGINFDVPNTIEREVFFGIGCHF
jgi:protein-arginine kinase activator protein McsA